MDVIKKRVFVTFIFILLLTNFVFAQSGLEDTAENIQDKVDNLQKGIDGAYEFTEKDKWDYLGEEWQNILLKSEYVSFLDASFKKINFLFFFLFGEDYSLSLTLLFTIILWSFFFYYFNKILNDFSGFSSEVSSIVAFLLVIVSAHIGLYKFISEIAFKIIFFREGVWGWIAMLIFVLIMITIAILLKSFGEDVKKRREELQKIREELEMKTDRIRMKGIEKAFEGIGEAFKE